jgi:opacity protein-like surface antigen
MASSCSLQFLLNITAQSKGLKKRIIVIGLAIFVCQAAFAQVRFSIATDISLLRNFSPHQKFWAFGQGVESDFHFSKKNSGYAWLNYHTQGAFTNRFTATADSSFTVPQKLSYNLKGKWRFRQVSLGLKHYFKGGFDVENDWNIYGAIGFGLMFTRVENELLTPVDTSLYTLSPAPVIGTDDFKRLTLDLGMGAEYPLAAGIFLYGDVRTTLPASDYPSPLLHDTRRVPLPLSANAGIRILFSFGE